MRKICKATEEELPKRFLSVLNGILGLTSGEIDLASVIISEYRKYGLDGVREPYISKLVFSTDGRKEIISKLENISSKDISSQNLGNKLNQLVNKGVLFNMDGMYSLNGDLLPVPEISFIFEIIDGPTQGDIQEDSGEAQ